jgi:hypothetical protein
LKFLNNVKNLKFRKKTNKSSLIHNFEENFIFKKFNSKKNFFVKENLDFLNLMEYFVFLQIENDKIYSLDLLYF